jgi:hypothetical protein
VSNKNKEDIIIEKVPLTIEEFDYYFKSFKDSSNCMEIPNLTCSPLFWCYDSGSDNDMDEDYWDWDNRWYKFVIDSRFVIILNSNHTVLYNFYFIFKRDVLTGYFCHSLCDSVIIIKNNKGNIIIVENTEEITRNKTDIDFITPMEMHHMDSTDFNPIDSVLMSEKHISFFKSINSKDYLWIYEYNNLYMPGDALYYHTDSKIILIDNSPMYEIETNRINIVTSNKHTWKHSIDLNYVNDYYDIKPILFIERKNFDWVQ